jgi:hypothetical protein
VPPPADAPVIDAAAASERPRWVKPAAIGSAGLAVAVGALAIQQGLQSRNDFREANRLVRTDGVIADNDRYRDLTRSGDRSRTIAWVGAGGAVIFAATAGVLGYLAWTDAGPAVRF